MDDRAAGAVGLVEIRRPGVSIFVTRSRGQWVIRDPEGNFWVVPGSHLSDTLERPAGGTGQPDGAVPVLARPGTAVLFDRRLWHTASPNSQCAAASRSGFCPSMRRSGACLFA